MDRRQTEAERPLVLCHLALDETRWKQLTEERTFQAETSPTHLGCRSVCGCCSWSCVSVASETSWCSRSEQQDARRGNDGQMRRPLTLPAICLRALHAHVIQMQNSTNLRSIPSTGHLNKSSSSRSSGA